MRKLSPAHIEALERMIEKYRNVSPDVFNDNEMVIGSLKEYIRGGSKNECPLCVTADDVCEDCIHRDKAMDCDFPCKDELYKEIYKWEFPVNCNIDNIISKCIERADYLQGLLKQYNQELDEYNALMHPIS